jgi:hypothetical protein
MSGWMTPTWLLKALRRMGNKVGEQTFMQYIRQLTGIQPVYDENLRSYLGRVFNDPGFFAPYDVFDVVQERCSFVEALVLGRSRSFLMQRLEMLEDTVVVGIEQSQSFSGKNSLFCAFAVDSYQHLADILGRVKSNLVRYPKGYPICVHADKDRILVTCPFSVFIIEN